MKKKQIKNSSTLATSSGIKKREVFAPRREDLKDPLVAYLSHIKKYPLLSKEEEFRVASEYKKTGDPELAKLLITSNLRFVVKIALEYAHFKVHLIDLIQEGNIGLMEAVRQYNPHKGTRVITYAVWWIRGNIQDYIMKQKSIVKMGTTRAQKKLFYNLEKESKKLEKMGVLPTPALLSERLDVPEKDIKIMSQRLKNPDVSWDKVQTSSFFPNFSEDRSDPQKNLELKEKVQMVKQRIQSLLPDLNEKEVYVLKKRLVTEEPQTLNEIGKNFGITREAVRQIESRLVKKIKDGLPD